MGIAAVNCRLMSIISYKNDLEYRIMNLSQQRQQLSMQTAALAEQYSQQQQANGGQQNSITDSPQYVAIHERDKALELEQKNLETQLKSVTTEYESDQKLLDENIKRDFKMFGS